MVDAKYLPNNERPVVAVDESNERTFEATIKALIDKGYRLHSSSCGFVQSERYDFCNSYQAIMVMDWATAPR